MQCHIIELHLETTLRVLTSIQSLKVRGTHCKRAQFFHETRTAENNIFR